MRAICIGLVVACLAHWAAGARILKAAADQPLVPGTPEPLQETFEYSRLALTESDSLVQNRVQAQAQQGGTDSLVTVILETRKTAMLDSSTRNSLGQNQAQAVVGGAVDGAGISQAAKEHFGAVQYQVFGGGMRTSADARSALASIDAQRQVMAALAAHDPSIATRGNANSAFATLQRVSHKFTD